MSNRALILVLLAAAALAFASLIDAPARAQGRGMSSRTPSFSDVLLRRLSKECRLRELPVPGTEQTLLVLDFAGVDAEGLPAEQRLKLSQIGRDFIVLETAEEQQIHLPHGMVALFDRK